MRMNEKRRGEVKCVIVGDGAVGKTSMLMSYTTGGIKMDYIPTCFDCYTVDVSVGEMQHTMSIIDTAGQETYDRLRTLSYYDTDVFVICFSVADEDSFNNVKTKWIPEIRQYRPGTPFILVGTKRDRRNSTLESSRLSAQMTSVSYENISVKDTKDVNFVSVKKAKHFSRKCGSLRYMECSALEGTGVTEVFSVAMEVAVAPVRKRPHSFISSIKSIFRKKSQSKRRLFTSKPDCFENKNI
ncbi:uncharacterized protein LOC127873962 [Dreissena polymorpha]|uniref:Uncharacterized protein n=1 Tax=Dreissena polymorpha TaxID=45954 RepID=A0A9D4KW35_DREPO|nr:uncharacterized protein LOC127873962 [Dreissena polymorpha]KAH3846966.1 hypothetical protein DPMN_089275 [Dreissena polymorpha]